MKNVEDQLAAAVRSFGPAAARTKLRLLAAARRTLPRGSRRLERLREALAFVRAHPDDARVRGAAEKLAEALPSPAPIVYSYSYPVVQRLVGLFPGRIELAWGDLENPEPLGDVLQRLVTPGEQQGLDDIEIPLATWFERCRPAGRTDLEFLLALLERSGLPPAIQDHLYEGCDLPVRFEGPDPLRLSRPPARLYPRRRDFDRSRFPIEPVILRPLARVARGGRAEIDLALQALCARRLEIYPLTHADPRDVVVADADQGLQFVIAGVRPEARTALESLFFFLVLCNGVPLGYGPIGAFAGCSEVGINLFPEFRGGGIRLLYAQFMRVLRHVLGIECFYLTRYAMGEANPDAIATGAFWFYRRLGFRPVEPAVERRARAEEARMAADPAHRSDRRTLHALSHTEALLDLSNGRCRPLRFGALGIAESRLVASRFGGDRERARRASARRVGRQLGLDPGGRALRALAPLLTLIPGLGGWSPGERAALVRFIRAKDARSERRAPGLAGRHRALVRALHDMA